MSKLTFEEWQNQRLMSGEDFATMGVMTALWGVQLASWAVTPAVGIVTTGAGLGICEALRQEQKRRIKREYGDYLNT